VAFSLLAGLRKLLQLLSTDATSKISACLEEAN